MPLGERRRMRTSANPNPNPNPNQEDEDIGLDNSKHGGSAYTHDLPSEMSVLNTGGDASKEAGRA